MSYIRIDLTGYAREPGFSHYEIWRHTADIPSPNSPPERVTRSATRVGEHVANERWEDTSAVGGRTYWYWARALDRYANPSPFFAVGTIIAPMANITMNSDRLLGRDTPGAGDVEEIEATAPLEFDGAGAVRIATQGVTFADHIQHIATARILGRLTAATGAIEGLTATDARDVLGLSTTSTVQFGQIGIGSGTLTGSIHVRMNTVADPPSFSVVASGLIVSRATGSGITLHTTDTGTNYIAFADTTLGTHHWIAYRHTDDALDIRTGNALRATVSAAGLTTTVPVGVGIAAPVSRAHVYENTASVGTTAGLTVEQAGAGDAAIQLLLTGVQRWVVGVDNSDGDAFKIGRGAGWGSGVDLAISTSGVTAIASLRTGTHAAIGAETVTGYITITDAAGVSRKLAVVS